MDKGTSGVELIGIPPRLCLRATVSPFRWSWSRLQRILLIGGAPPNRLLQPMAELRPQLNAHPLAGC